MIPVQPARVHAGLHRAPGARRAVWRRNRCRVPSVAPPACWSPTPLCGLVPIAQMMLDTVFGGDGVGLINLITFAILTVFLVGMMIDRDLTLLPILAVAGSLAAKQSVQESAGTLSTSTSTAPASSRASPRTAARSARCRSIRMTLEQEGLDTCEVATAREARMTRRAASPCI